MLQCSNARVRLRLCTALDHHKRRIIPQLGAVAKDGKLLQENGFDLFGGSAAVFGQKLCEPVFAEFDQLAIGGLHHAVGKEQ